MLDNPCLYKSSCEFIMLGISEAVHVCINSACPCCCAIFWVHDNRTVQLFGQLPTEFLWLPYPLFKPAKVLGYDPGCPVLSFHW